MSNPYPTLAFVETLIADPNHSFRDAPDASRLERFARRLLNELWGDQSWQAGRVADPSLAQVVRALELYRAGGDEREILRATTSGSDAARDAHAP